MFTWCLRVNCLRVTFLFCLLLYTYTCGVCSFIKKMSRYSLIYAVMCKNIFLVWQFGFRSQWILGWRNVSHFQEILKTNVNFCWLNVQWNWCGLNTSAADSNLVNPASLVLSHFTKSPLISGDGWGTLQCVPHWQTSESPVHNIHAILLLTDMCCNLFENEHLQHVRASKLWVWEEWERKWHRKTAMLKKRKRKTTTLPWDRPFNQVLYRDWFSFLWEQLVVSHSLWKP